MRKQYWYIIASLLFCLFIYIFYRTDQTVINGIFAELVTNERYLGYKHVVLTSIPLHDYIVYSLPEGLWVFVITLTSKSLYVQFYKYRIHCAIVPILFSVVLECFQLFHVTNGIFDVADISFSFFFWVIAYYYVNDENDNQNVFKPVNKRSIICVFSYAIVYLSHVWK